MRFENSSSGLTFSSMEEIKKAVKQVAYTPRCQWLSRLSPWQLSLVPLLSVFSSLYSIAVRLRHQLYRFDILAEHRLPVPVISVGNLTWGGNGKTPMVEFLARSFADVGICPLILTRGYGGADEAKMLGRQLKGTSARIGVGADRAATAATFLKHYGYSALPISSLKLFEKTENRHNSDRIGLAILDDGMQHLRVRRDLEIVMVNSLMPWGNNQLLPAGPLREPLTALSRADIVIIHHADLVQEKEIIALESTIQEVNESVQVFFTKMAPIHFFAYADVTCKLPLEVVANNVVLCVSGIGLPESFFQAIAKMGPSHVDRIDFSDHHFFQLKEIELVRSRLHKLETKFGSKPTIVITEKDYDRAPEVLDYLKPYEVLVLCCRLQFMSYNGSSEDGFKKIIVEQLVQSNKQGE